MGSFCRADAPTRHRLVSTELRNDLQHHQKSATAAPIAYGRTRAVTGYDGARVQVASRRNPRAEWMALKPLSKF
jgi:hypothetical protein